MGVMLLKNYVQFGGIELWAIVLACVQEGN